MAKVKGSQPPMVTRAGTALDEAYERSLSEEAETGYDPDSLTRRPAGRPSLSGRSGNSRRVDLRVDDTTYEAIRHLAEQSDRGVSDVVREAIEQYLKAS